MTDHTERTLEHEFALVGLNICDKSSGRLQKQAYQRFMASE